MPIAVGVSRSRASCWAKVAAWERQSGEAPITRSHWLVPPVCSNTARSSSSATSRPAAKVVCISDRRSRARSPFSIRLRLAALSTPDRPAITRSDLSRDFRIYRRRWTIVRASSMSTRAPLRTGNSHRCTLTVRDRHAVQRVEQARPPCWPARGQCRGEYVAHGLNEAVLRREVGGPDVIRDQARWLVEVATLPNVTVQVLPFSAGAHPGMTGPFTMLGFAERSMNEIERGARWGRRGARAATAVTRAATAARSLTYPTVAVASETPRIRPARLDVYRGRMARVHECASISFTDPVTRNGPTWCTRVGPFRPLCLPSSTTRSRSHRCCHQGHKCPRPRR
jgi:uncharacterized protein DUF5753